MSEDFVPDTSEMPAVPVSRQPSFEPIASREPVKILIIGSPKAVNKMIHTLYRLRFAEVSEWSPLQPTTNPGEVVSLLRRQLVVE